MKKRTFVFSTLLVGLCLVVNFQSVNASGAFASPVRIHALWNNTAPYSNAELDYVAKRVAVLTGSDNHGFTFPGQIDEVLGSNPALDVNCSWDAMAIWPDGERWAALDPRERSFIHSADPASLRVAPLGNGRASIAFRIDGRARPFNREVPVGVDRYRVEWAPSAEGPFTLLQEVTEELTTWVHTVEDSGYQPNRHYRVRTVFTDQTINEYSWVATVDAAQDAHFLYALLLQNGSMWAGCFGAGCPSDPTQVMIEADRNHNRTIDNTCEDSDSDGIVDQPTDCERWHFSVATAVGNGYFYTGTFVEDYTLFDYQVVLSNASDVAIPAGKERYQVLGYNNRIQMHIFGSYLLWPDNPDFQAQTQERLAQCLQHGYTGMRLDFAMTDVSHDWMATSVPPNWDSGDEQRLRDGMRDHLTALQESAPNANITINGYFAAIDKPSYYSYVEPITGGEIEWFAFGGEAGASQINESVYEAMGAMMNHDLAGKSVVARAADLGPGGPENHDARRKSLALYLIMASENSYYYYSATDYYAALEYYPEWDLALGDPLVPLDEVTREDFMPVEYADVIGREFENGWSLFNTSADNTVTVSFVTPVHEVELVGGRVPELGGDGALRYEQRTEIVIAPRDGVLILKAVP